MARYGRVTVGAHKGRKWHDKPSVVRYWATNRRRENKLRNVKRCNGAAYAARWAATH